MIRHATPADPELLDRSDDEYFCDLCGHAGIDVWADLGCVCHHPHELTPVAVPTNDLKDGKDGKDQCDEDG